MTARVGTLRELAWLATEDLLRDRGLQHVRHRLRSPEFAPETMTDAERQAHADALRAVCDRLVEHGHSRQSFVDAGDIEA